MRATVSIHRARAAIGRSMSERRGRKRDRETLLALRGRSDLRINVGSSSSHLDGWINADLLRDAEGLCLKMDATQEWPFEAGSAEAINSEHFIEHLDVDDARAYFRQAHQAMRPGGVIRTSTPDLEGIARAYVDNDASVLATHREHGYEASCLGDMVNNYTYMWGHRHMFDLQKLRELLEEAGFTEVERASYGESRHDVLRGIDRHDMRPIDRLVIAVDAVKPG